MTGNIFIKQCVYFSIPCATPFEKIFIFLSEELQQLHNDNYEGQIVNAEQNDNSSDHDNNSNGSGFDDDQLNDLNHSQDNISSSSSPLYQNQMDDPEVYQFYVDMFNGM